MPMTEERKGEIALAVEKYRAEKDGLKINKDTRQEINRISKGTGISVEELLELARGTIQELTDKHLSS